MPCTLDERGAQDAVAFGLMTAITGSFDRAHDGQHRDGRRHTQAVFLKLWSAPDAFRDGHFAAWLSRVTRNRTLDLLRSRALRSAEEIPGDLAAAGSLDDDVFARIDAERVRAAMSALSEEQRVAIEMGFFGGITHEEIARRTGVPLGTIKTRIRSGLRRMREALGATVST